MKTPRVLIIGAGFAGMETALSLAAHNIPVVLVEKEKQPGGVALMIGHMSHRINDQIRNLETTAGIDLQTSVEPLKIKGVKDTFTVLMKYADGRVEEKTFSHIVFAHGLEWVYPSSFPLPRSETALDLLQVECGLRDGTFPRESGRIVFLSGFYGYVSPFLTRVAFQQALKLREIGRPVMIITDMMRFDYGWVSDLYRRCREAGIVFVKTPEAPVWESVGKGYRFKVLDPGLGMGGQKAFLTGKAAYVVIDPMCLPRDTDPLFWSPHRLDRDEAGFHPEENLYYAPIKSGRAGIYFAGAATGPKDIEACRREADAVVADILSRPVPHLTAFVEESKCAACLTCVRLCPHHAIIMDRVAVINHEACFGCGTCVAECPAEAIELLEPDGNPMNASTFTGAPVTVFCCEGSTRAAIEKALKNNLISDTELDIHSIPCSGNVDILDILDAFGQGSKGVFIATCQNHNCKHIQGNRRAERRADRARSILAELDIPRHRIFTGAFASNMDIKLAGALNRFIKEVES